MNALLGKLCPLFVVGGALCLMTGCASPGHSVVEAPNLAPGQIDAGALYKQNCAKCHGQDGRTRTLRGVLMGAQNLTDPEWQAITSEKQISSAIRRGPGAMPAFEEKLSATQIAALAKHVQNLKRE